MRAQLVDATPSDRATLRHVVRQTGYHRAGQTRHVRKLTTNQNRGK